MSGVEIAAGVLAVGIFLGLFPLSVYVLGHPLFQAFASWLGYPVEAWALSTVLLAFAVSTSVVLGSMLLLGEALRCCLWVLYFLARNRAVAKE